MKLYYFIFVLNYKFWLKVVNDIPTEIIGWQSSMGDTLTKSLFGNFKISV